MKDELFQQNTWKYDIFFRCFERWSFQKDHTGTWDFLYYLERWYLFLRKHNIFFGQKMKDDLSKEILGDTVFSAYMQALKTWCWAYPPKKDQRWPSPTKIHLKMIDTLVWHFRKGSNNSVYFYENLCRLFHILLFTKKIHSRH